MVKNSPGKQNYGYAAISASYDTSKEKKGLFILLLQDICLSVQLSFHIK